MKCLLGSQSPPSFIWKEFHLAHIIRPIIFMYVKKGGVSLEAGSSGSSDVSMVQPGDIFKQCACVQVSEGRHPFSPIHFRNRRHYIYKAIWNTFLKEYLSPEKMPKVRQVRLLPIHVSNNHVLLYKKNKDWEKGRKQNQKKNAPSPADLSLFIY